ncbi:MAG: PAS domain S-box protein [Proteobacteria bacterium]|nr:PAS domain S-box protein [Pseudomonadota bacterium]
MNTVAKHVLNIYKNSCKTKKLQEELYTVLTQLFDIMFLAGGIFGGIALLFSIYRSINYGWYPAVFLHTGMYLFAMVILFFRRRISVIFMFSALLSLICVDVLYSLINMGLASAGFASLTVLCIFAGVFLGVRAGIIAMCASILTASLIGAGICTGMINMKPDIINHISAPVGWIVQIACFVVYVMPLILAINSIQQKMVRSLSESRETNEKLQAEILVRRRAVEELQESEKKYRNIFENAVEGIFQATPDGEVLNVNPSLARMAGFASPQDMVKNIKDLNQFYVDSQDRDHLKKIISEQGYVEGFEVQLYRQDRSIAWISMNARAVCSGEGHCVYLEGSIEDISKRKSAEIALRESEEKYRTVVENSLVGSFIIQDGLFRFVNPLFCKISGYTYNEIIDKLSPLDIILPDEREKIRKNLESRMDGNTCQSEYELKVVRKDGKVITIKILGNFIIYNGRPASFGTLIDITKEVALESQLRQAQKMEAIGTLAGGIAHDFNNIITALIGFGTLLQMKMDRTDPLRIYVEQILSASRKAASLTQSLLAFSRQQPITLKPLNVNNAVRGSEKLLQRLITEDIAFTTDLGAEDITIMADASQIDQILFNLVSNARDAMPRGGNLIITTKAVELDREFVLAHGFGETGQYALIAVSDTGTGMDTKTKENIFDPFFTTKAIGKGTGLGLSTVYGIVKQHGGYITTDSWPNKGTIFNVYLPVVKSAVHNIQPSVELMKGGRETILVAEDDEDVRLFVKDILSEHGYTVIEAVNGNEAIERFREHKGISLLVLDSIMPRKNGIDVYNATKIFAPDIKALFMSGYTLDMVSDKGVEQSEYDFIKKPLLPDELLKKVREILDRQ